MKQTIIMMALAIGLLSPSRASSLLWPIKGQTTGTNILLRPQDLLDHESNFCTLIIGAAEGTEVIAPADGEVSGIYLVYMPNLVTSTTYGYDDAKTFDAMRKRLETEPDVRNPKKYINGSLNLKLDDGRTISFEGLRGDIPWRSGQRVKAGTVLGTVSYVFEKIGQPHIALSFSKGGKAIDPMSPFGLETTFKQPKPFTPPAKLTREQANEDFDSFIQSIRECYPSLRDIISPEQEEAFIRKAKTRLDSAQIHFSTLYDLIGDAFTAEFLHDSHAWRQSSNPFFNNRTDVQYPSVMLCTLGERMFVRLVQPGYEAHIGKEVATINGVSAKEQVAYVRSKTSLFDAQVESTRDVQTLTNWWMQYRGTFWDKPVSLTFTDGTSVEAPFLKANQMKRYVPQPSAPTAYYNHQRQNRMEDWSFRLIEDSIALLTLAHFHLNEVQMETIEDSLRSHAHVPYLIIDVRDNPGGDADCEERLVKLFIKEEPSNFGYQKVMSNTTYPCFAHSFNWSADMRPFEGFVKVEGKEGYYNRRPTDPDSPPALPIREGADTIRQNEGKQPSKVTAPSLTGRAGGESRRGIGAEALFILTNENSASAATDFPAHLVRAGRAKTIGRETATAYHYMTALKFARLFLPHSHIEYQLPLVKAVTATNVSARFPYGRGLLPDYEVPLTREELFSSTEDIILQRALEIIHTNKQQQNK
jgi:hypothetical protein